MFTAPGCLVRRLRAVGVRHSPRASVISVVAGDPVLTGTKKRGTDWVIYSASRFICS